MCTCCFLGQKLSSLMKGVDLEIGIGIGIGIGRYQHKSTWYWYRNSKCGIAQHYWGKLLLCNQTLSPAQGVGSGHETTPRQSTTLCLVLFMHPSVLDYNSTPPTCGGRDFYFPLRTALGYKSPPRIQLKGSPRTQLIWHLYPPGHIYFTPLDTITCPPET